MKALSLAIQKIWPMLEFLKSRSNSKVTGSKNFVPIERSCHEEHTYEIPITYNSKDMANAKVFADRQTDKRTGQNLYAPDLSIRGPPIFRYRGIKRSIQFPYYCTVI
jgi:hypothetical protein